MGKYRSYRLGNQRTAAKSAVGGSCKNSEVVIFCYVYV